MLVELSVMEQRYQAVMAVVQDGWTVTEVANRLGVARHSVHNWIARYVAGGLPALADRSHRPQSCAHQITPELEALICELRPKLQQAHRPEDGTYVRSMQILGEELDLLSARDDALASNIGKGMSNGLTEGMSQLDDWQEFLRPRIVRRLEAAETP